MIFLYPSSTNPDKINLESYPADNGTAINLPLLDKINFFIILAFSFFRKSFDLFFSEDFFCNASNHNIEPPQVYFY